MESNPQLKMSLDDKNFVIWMNNVKGTKLKAALKSGLRKSLNIIKKKAVENLKTITWKNGKGVNLDKDVTFKNAYGVEYGAAPFKKGIVIKLKKSAISGRVEIITKNTDKNWNPILKMWENSKGNRETSGNSHKGIKRGRKAHSTGTIGRFFFSDAIKKTRNEVQSSLQKNLDDAIMIAKRKTEEKQQ